MNNDYYNRNNRNSDQNDHLMQQQFFPGGPPGPGGQPGGAPMGMQPPSAPPNFTPQLPRMGEPGPTGYGRYEERGGREGRGREERRGPGFRPPRDLRRCINRFTFIWLVNGNSFWFYPIAIRGQFVEGFRWRRNHWEYDRININRILFHSCY